MGEHRLGASQLKDEPAQLKGEDCSPLRADSGESPRPPWDSDCGSATSLSQVVVVSAPISSCQLLCGDDGSLSQSVSLPASLAGPQSCILECSVGERSVDSTTHVRRRPSTSRREGEQERGIRMGELASEAGAELTSCPPCPPRASIFSHGPLPGFSTKQLRSNNRRQLRALGCDLGQAATPCFYLSFPSFREKLFLGEDFE